MARWTNQNLHPKTSWIASGDVAVRPDRRAVAGVLEPLLPAPKPPDRRSLWSRRQLIDGIRWRTRVDAPWREVPPRYGSWSACMPCF